MTILLIIVLGLAGIIALLLILALFVAKKYSIQRQIIINRPNKEVFDYIKLLKNQDYYNKWCMADLNAKKEFRGSDGTIGYVVSWESDNKQVGKGEQEIVKIREGERIDYEIRFEKPFEGISDVYIATEAVSANQTKMTWVFRGANKYPMNLMNLMMDNLLGKDLQASSTNLKNLLEKK